MERGKPFRQIVAAFIANIGVINTGLIFGFSAVAIPQLEAPDSKIQIDEYQASWIGKFCANLVRIRCQHVPEMAKCQDAFVKIVLLI